MKQLGQYFMTHGIFSGFQYFVVLTFKNVGVGEGRRRGEREKKRVRTQKVSIERNRDEQNFEKHIHFRKKLIEGLYSGKMG